MRFDELDLEEAVLDGLDAMNFLETTPVQELTIPVILEGKDIIACAQTGTGKTAAYVLPVINELSKGLHPANAINAIIMALAGGQRIFDLLDEKPEVDEGKVMLVNAKRLPDDSVTETKERTNLWAWKRVNADGSADYRELKGDIVFKDVDFGYDPGKIVLHDINLYGRPGQKIAFVGSTGAGKTTITNLINRFYDIQKGTIEYDGIDVTHIHKDDLRASLGIVLQDTHLFTGTVMDNIRYGRLDATDEECRAAAKLANADEFIRHLPDGYNTTLTGDGTNLSRASASCLPLPVPLLRTRRY